MNARQKWVVGAGLALFLLTVLFPPERGWGFRWRSVLDWDTTTELAWTPLLVAWLTIAVLTAGLCLILSGPGPQR